MTRQTVKEAVKCTAVLIASLFSVSSSLAAEPARQTAASSEATSETFRCPTAVAGLYCKVDLNNEHPDCDEAQSVIETLKSMVKAICADDINGIAQHIADDCTTFDEATHQLVVGKPSIVTNIKKLINDHSGKSESPLIGYAIENPFAKIHGNTCVVTYLARRTFGGKKEEMFESHCTDVFVKQNGQWKMLHYRSNWKRAS